MPSKATKPRKRNVRFMLNGKLDRLVDLQCVRANDIADEARTLIKLNQADIIGQLILEIGMIGDVEDDPTDQPAASAGRLPAPVGMEALGTLRAWGKPSVAAPRAALKLQPSLS